MPKSSNYEIKTTLAIDGEKKFKAAMEEANRAMRVHKADLRAVAAEYEYSGDKQKFYSQRADLLTEEMKQQEAVVEALQRAVRESGDMYGTAAKQTDGYRIKLSNATAKMFEMRKEAEQANRDLEDLGRDSGKIGRQIERGIGDAAEDTADKLDGMFEKVAKDVNALKSTVAFETSMNVGSFVLDGIQNIMGFVQENQEFNRRMAQTKTIVEMYGYNAEEIINIAKYAGSIIGDFENAQEAIVNLAAAGFDSEEQIKATVESLLGIWLSSAGTLDFSGLAEDYLESVNEKTPTGTYAEAIIKFTDKSVEDVQKVLESMKSHADTLEAATAVLTEAGLQTKTKNYVEQNEEIVKAEAANINLASAWAELALELQPVVTDLTSALTTAVTTVTDWVDWAANVADKYGDTISSLIDMTLEKTIPGYNIATSATKSVGALFSGKAQTNYDLFNQAYEEYFGKQSPLQSFFEWLLPSAGAETLPTEELQEYGFQSAQEIAMGMQAGMENNAAVNAAVKTALAEMRAEDVLAEANLAGKNIMIEFGNGIAEGTSIPLNNVANMVNQINAMLSQIAAPAFGLGWSGMTGGNIYLYNQQRNNARTISRFIGSGVQNQTLKN